MAGIVTYPTPAASGGSGQTYVDRGDPSSFDFTVSSLTTDNTWNDLDLSSIVAADGASNLVHLLVAVQDGSTNVGIQFRENGNSNGLNVSICWINTSGQDHYFDVLVLMDASRIIEYKASNTTFTTINIAVRGWWE